MIQLEPTIERKYSMTTPYHDDGEGHQGFSGHNH